MKNGLIRFNVCSVFVLTTYSYDFTWRFSGFHSLSGKHTALDIARFSLMAQCHNYEARMRNIRLVCILLILAIVQNCLPSTIFVAVWEKGSRSGRRGSNRCIQFTTSQIWTLIFATNFRRCKYRYQYLRQNSRP